MNFVYGIVITLAGIPVYLVCIKWQNKPECYSKIYKGIEYICQILFNAVWIDGNEKEN